MRLAAYLPTDHCQILSLGQFVTEYIVLDHGQGRSAAFLTTSSDLSTLNSVSTASTSTYPATDYPGQSSWRHLVLPVIVRIQSISNRPPLSLLGF
jgi:hypothetical protein